MKLTQYDIQKLNKQYEKLYKNFDLDDFKYELLQVQIHLQKNKVNIEWLEEKIKELEELEKNTMIIK